MVSERKKTLIAMAERKEIIYSVTKIKRTKEEDIDKIWDEIQKERLSETNELLAHTFVEKLCDILESTNIIESGKETSDKLKDRKAFMVDVKNMASYFSALIPYIGVLEGGIVLGKDVYDHKLNPRIVEIDKNETNRTCKITNITCHWDVINIEENITVTIGSDSLVFKKGFWDFESLKIEFKTKSVDLESLSHDNTCTLYHASENINLKNLGPYLGFTKDKTISSGNTETSPDSVNLFKGLSQIEIYGNFVNRSINLDQGDWSSLLTRIPIDTKQILNGSITFYQPWSSSPIYQNTVSSLEFEVKDEITIKRLLYSFLEIEFQ